MKDNFGWANNRALKKLEKIANQIEAMESVYCAMDNETLQSQTALLKGKLANGATLDDILVEAFAVCREAAKRVLKQRHYHVQLLGGIALHQGRICQMATGEGKTLTETLPAYLNALTGKGVHIVTVNPYLASRDAEWMGKVFKFLGLTVGVVSSTQTPTEKRNAYNQDVTYTTNNELGFDYLRDNMKQSLEARVQRSLNFVIIDEVDSILIDEARTPLIISDASGKTNSGYMRANAFARTLRASTNVDVEGNLNQDEEEPNGDYVVDLKHHSATLTSRGMEKAERFYQISNLAGDMENFNPDVADINHYINNALKANAIMKRDKDYIVEKGQVIIVDQFTGRKMEGRRYNDGLHQAIEAKENVRVQQESRTVATITFQNFFRLYKKMSGMTGTAKTEEREFNQIYNVDVVAIPTNLPCVRVDHPDIIYRTREEKLQAIVELVKETHQKGQPILLGTATVEKSEELSDLLVKAGVKHNVLNAKNHQREAEIVAQAGRVGAVTIATNMAGRGTDILLGGNPEYMAKNQMLAQGYTSEDIEIATSYVEGDQRTTQLQKTFGDLVAKFKIDTDKEKQQVLETGGLFVIGSEKHESRRIDNQLRGRSGRQGDKGMSVFFVSCQDEMMRVHAGPKLEMILNFVNFPYGEAIQNKTLSKVLEMAQQQLEGLHFTARKNVLQFDDVNNLQRQTIYDQRNLILSNESIYEKIKGMASTYTRKALEFACGGEEDTTKWNIAKVNALLTRFLPFERPFIDESNTRFTARQVHQDLTKYAQELLEQRKANFDEDFPFDRLQKFFYLRAIDKYWMEEIDALESLRRGVGLQAIGQHNPIDVYKKEAFQMFTRMQENIEVDTFKGSLFGNVVVREQVEQSEKFKNTPIRAKRDEAERLAEREQERLRRIEERKKKVAQSQSQKKGR